MLTTARAVATAHGDLRSQLLVRHAEAYVDWSRGDHLRAAACAEAALELGRDCLTPMDRIRLQRVLGLARLGLEDYAAALALSRDNLAAARACGTRLDEGLALGLKGEALLLLGRTAESRDALQAGAEVLGDLGAHHQRSRILNRLEAAGSRARLSSSTGLNGNHVGLGQRGSSPGAGGSLARLRRAGIHEQVVPGRGRIARKPRRIAGWPVGIVTPGWRNRRVPACPVLSPPPQGRAGAGARDTQGLGHATRLRPPARLAPAPSSAAPYSSYVSA